MKIIQSCIVEAILFSLFLHALEGKEVAEPPPLSCKLLSTASYEIQGALPGLSIQTRGKQKIEGTLNIDWESDPLNCSFTLEHLDVQLDANGVPVQFFSGGEHVSQAQRESAFLLREPLHFQIDRNGKINCLNLHILKRQYPHFSSLVTESMLYALFAPVFPFYGETVSKGAVIERTLKGKGIQPQRLEFSIEKIVGQRIEGEICGHTYKSTLPLNDRVSALINGTIQGRGVWRQRASPLADLTLEYDYVVRFIKEQKEWIVPAHVRIHTKLTQF